MAKKWNEVVNNPEYQKLDAAQKEAARNEYFEFVVKPNVPDEDLEKARAEFDSFSTPSASDKLSNVYKEGLTGLKNLGMGALRKTVETGIFGLDRANDLVQGAITVPEAVVGLADIPTGGRVGKALEEVGYKPGEAKQYLTEQFSNEQKAANQAVSDADGFIDKSIAAIQNPRSIVSAVTQSAPLMGAGGVVGRGAVALGAKPVIAGAVGEGVISAGSAAEGTRQQTKDGLLTGKQSGLAVASGLGTALTSVFGGKLAQKLGIADIDTVIAGGVTEEVKKSLAKRLVLGGMSEGVFEEMPQSIQEQILSNIALDKPLTEGVDEAAAMGLLSGTAMGGGASALLSGKKKEPGTEDLAAASNALMQENNGQLLTISQGGEFSDDALAAQKQAEYDAAEAKLSEQKAEKFKTLPDKNLQNLRKTAQTLNPADVPVIDAEIERRASLGTLTRAAEISQQADPLAAQPVVAPAIPVNNEAIDAADLLEAENVSDLPNDAIADVVADTTQEESNNVQGSLGNIPNQYAGRSNTGGADNTAEALTQSSRSDQPSGNGVQGNDSVAILNGEIEESRPFAQAADDFLPKMRGMTTDDKVKAQIDEELKLRGIAVNSEASSDVDANKSELVNDKAAVAGEKINKEWTAFSPESGTLNIPRSEMPQVKAEHRGAMVNFLNARGVDHTQETVPASSLKPTQQEFSEAKVKKASKYAGGDRSILVSSDNHVLDGHHQWLSKLNKGGDVDVIRLNAPIAQLLDDVKEFPSSTVENGATQAQPDNGKTNSLSRDSSWVIRNKQTGEVIQETFQKSVADKVNTEKYEAVPIGKYLAELNQEGGMDRNVMQGNAVTATVPASDTTTVPAKAKKPKAPKQYKPKTLLATLRDLGGIALTEKRDVTGEVKGFAPGGYNQVFKSNTTRSLKGLIESGDLDDYLPYNMRLESNGANDGAFDSTEAYDYLADKIRNGSPVLPYDVEEELRAALYQARQEEDQNPFEDDDVFETTAAQLSDEDVERLFNGTGTNETREDNQVSNESITESERSGVDGSDGNQETTQTNASQQAEVADSNTDLLGDNTTAKQAIADAERAKDSKRNSGNDNQDTFTLTGSNSEADQAAAAGAQDLFDAPSEKLAPGTRINGEVEKSAADRLEQLLEEINKTNDAKFFSRGEPLTNAKNQIQNAVEELRKSKTVSSIEGMLAQSSSALSKNYGALADVVDQVIESLEGKAAPKETKTSDTQKATDNKSGTSLSDLKDLRAKISEQLQSQGMVVDARLEDRLKQVNAEISRIENEDAEASEKAKAKADLDAALGDLGDIFGKTYRKNITQEQEQKLIPVLTRVFDAAFRLGYYEFKDAAKFVIDTIRSKIGTDVAETVNLDQLQGAYISMAGKYGDKATSKRDVVNIDSIAEILEGSQNARTNQTEQVQPRGTQSDLLTEQPRDSDSEPMDARVGRSSEGADASRNVQRGISETSGSGATSASGSNGNESPSGSRKASNDGNTGSTANVDNFEITDNTSTGEGSISQKYANNIAAIKIIKTLDAEKRLATPEEREKLAKYAGFGALAGAFDKNNTKFAKEYAELKELLTTDEYEAARASILNAYFTSPTIVKTMYEAIAQIGFKNGRVLEPSMGSGNFFGMMPATMRNKSSLNGVELDVITSRIAKHLYPKANVAVATGFQDYEAPEGYFDLVISNPPFGSEKITDTAKRGYSGFSIHNYFIAKSIDKLREGGVMAVVVSHSFMDAQNSQAREWISKRANLLGAVRLPKEAFKDIAGTEVITDILYFQKTSTPKANPDWINSTNNGDYSFNDYFYANPRNVLGRIVNTTNQFGKTFTIESLSGNGTLAQQLKAFNERLPQGVYVEPSQRVEVLDSADNTVPDGVKVGTFYKDSSGVIRQRIADMLGAKRSQAWEVPSAKAQERMEGMMALRDLLRNQMRLERDPMATEKDIEANRKQLNTKYDAFLKEFGYLNSMTNRRLFLDDTESALVQALEMDYDAGVTKAKALSTGMEAKEPSAQKADIFKRRVLFPPSDSITVNNAQDALLQSLDAKGGVDIDYMAEVYNKPADEIISELGELVYNDPQKGLVTADEYLSGDVKTKLDEAKKAALTDTKLNRNVEALQQVIPKDKLPSEIFASPGANWIPADVYESFASEITGIPKEAIEFNYVSAAATWLTDKTRSGDAGKMTSDYGTDDLNSFQLFTLLVNGRSAEVKKSVPNGEGGTKQVVDIKKTDAANAKYQKIKELWSSWVFSDPERADRLASIYNDKHNRIVARKFDGSHMNFYGMSPSIKLIASQKNVVWRAIQDRNVLFDHVVGAGKTFAMAATAMEMKRLGISRKPMFVVPNHLTLQWRSEFTRLYPASNILAATPEDFAKDKREKMFSKMVTGNYDAIIIGHSSLTKVGLPALVEEKMYQEQVKELSDAIEAAKTERGDRGITRDMEKIKKNLEAKIDKLKEKAGAKDNVVTWDELGIDGLFIDEMHEFKNLFFTTQMQRTAGLGNPAGSGKALDLFMKVRHMQQTIGENAPLITATGTPVSNSLAEMFTMQRYMKYDHMKRSDLHLFDAWAKQYGEIENVYEVAPSGVGYRQSTRFSKFKNLPSLMANYTSFADVITLQDLKDQSASQGKVFPVPKIASGRPINVIAQRSELQRDYFGIPKLDEDEAGNIKFELDIEKAGIEAIDDGKYRLSFENGFKDFDTRDAAALELVTKSLMPKTYLDPESLLGKFANLKELTQKTKGKINALSLTGLANKAGLDFRIINPSAPDFAGSKINLAVGNMVSLWKDTAKDKGTQIVFCDMSVPASARASAASKERYALVRDRNSQLIHKKATLHTAEGFEGFPFYIVESGSKDSKSFAVYEPLSGLLLREGMKDKQSAKEYMANLVSTDNGRDSIFAIRDRNETITKDDIDEYFAEQEKIEIADDGGNLITPEDLESIAGSSQFSVYDDIKAKLIGKGVPEVEIAFIHDYNTPKQKEELFKRVNRGEVRFLFGSTPKLGAGTNVQKRLVGLHHIDAPWRPSDLEQREGRIIRQGNELYARDPDNFEVSIWRYATEQTYDTRRWQLLEHKASGIEQLRKYSGESEIEDVAGEASNSADMKAAASGNPLVLEETKLRTEVKRLQNLEKAHADSKFSMLRKIRQNEGSINEYYPRNIAKYEDMISLANQNPIPSDKDKVALTIVDGQRLTDREKTENAIGSMATRVRQAFNMGDVKVINYRGIEFTVERGISVGMLKLMSPSGHMHTYLEKDNFSPSGLITRFNNYIDSLESRIEQAKAQIAVAEKENSELQPRLNDPFEQADLLKKMQARHDSVKRKLMKSTQLEAVPENQLNKFNKLLEQRRNKLIEAGYEDVLKKAEAEDDDVPMFSRNDPFFSLGTGTRLQLKKSKYQFGAKVLNKALVKYFGDNWSDSFESVDVPDTLLAYKQEIKTAFGKELRFVSPTSDEFDIFSGVQLPKSPDAIYVNARAEENLTTIAGHEIYHTLERSRPDLHSWFKSQAKQHLVNFGTYHKNLNDKLQKGEKPYKSDVAMSELLADFTGDALSDPVFLQQLANADGSKFKGLLNTTIRFLNEAITKLKNLKSSQYISDVEALRDKLKQALLAFSSGKQISDFVPKLDAESDEKNKGILYSRNVPNPAQSRLTPQWETLEESSLTDNVIRKLQDKNIDLKRVTQSIKAAGVDLADRWNAYLQEELYHGRSAKRVQDFLDNELNPLIENMRELKVSMADLEQYLWNRHAEERNIQVAKVNPDMPDGGSGINTQAAQDYLAALTPEQKANYEALAARVYAINAGSRQTLVDYGLESAGTIAAWNNAYKNYVPLKRDEMDLGFGMGTGQGFSVKGAATKRAMGSSKEVVDIIANIAQQREQYIIRGEKNRVATALIGLAKTNPNEDFWQVDSPPRIRAINKQTGLVEEYTDPNYKNHPNVIVARIVNKRGEVEERSVVFEKSNERAMRMAASMKNLDIDQMEHWLRNWVAPVTRYIASVNTQYNPIFGILNITRDVQGALLNLTTTPIAGKQKEVLINTGKAMAGIYKDMRSVRDGKGTVDTQWSTLWEEFQREGGKTGYRDMHANAAERSKALEKSLDPTWWKNTKLGIMPVGKMANLVTANGFLVENDIPYLRRATIKSIFNWLSDYNETLENSVRLATYKVAIDSGLSKQQSASIAKNISVNFNRKGNMGQNLGALYAFFNASVQGTARLAETLTGKRGKQVIGGLLLLGSMQAVAMMLAGFGDDEPPEFVRDRNIIIPLGNKRYGTIPIALGYNAISNVGRILTEWALSGFDKTNERLVHILSMAMEAYNPIGGNGSLLNMLAPTFADPIVDLTTNKDWTGRQISREDFNKNAQTAGFTRSRDKTWTVSRELARYINMLSGGTEYTAGHLSPTGDEIEYLAGQAFGGVGRELIKAGTTADSLLTGEDLPPYKVPLVGRFYGDANGQSSQGAEFYNNLRMLGKHETEIKGRRADKISTQDYRSENPEAALISHAKQAQKIVSNLQKIKQKKVDAGAPAAEVKAVDERITKQMQKLNDLVRKKKEAADQ